MESGDIITLEHFLQKEYIRNIKRETGLTVSLSKILSILIEFDSIADVLD